MTHPIEALDAKDEERDELRDVLRDATIKLAASRGRYADAFQMLGLRDEEQKALLNRLNAELLVAYDLFIEASGKLLGSLQ